MLTEIKDYLERNSMEKLFALPYSPEIRNKIGHILSMTAIAMKIAENDPSIDKDLLHICCMHHDDGYPLELQLNSITNNQLTHESIGLSMLDSYLCSYRIELTPEIQILRACIYYHGSPNLIPETLDAQTRKYVKIVSEADRLESEFINPIRYLSARIAGDILGYRLLYPEFNKNIRPELFELFKINQLPSNFECRSYAEHMLFEASRIVTLAKKYGEISKFVMESVPCYGGSGYNSALSAYPDIFRKCMTHKDAKLATKFFLDLLK